MGWQEILKDNRQSAYEVAKQKLKEKLEVLVSYPRFDLQETIDVINDNIYTYRKYPYYDDFARMLLTGEITLEPVSIGEDPILDYVKENHTLIGVDMGDDTELFKQAIGLMANTRKLFVDIRIGMSKVTSMKFLESIARDFGITLEGTLRDMTREGSVRFRHEGLVFVLNPGGVKILIPHTAIRIYICVVDKKNLPLGDFFASMLGVIVAKPNQLDVINFGIQLGQIMLSYSGYDWVKSIDNNTGGIRQVSIFSPFNAGNTENLDFSDMLEYIANDDHDLAYDVLEKIEGALEDCFGSTRGFF